MMKDGILHPWYEIGRDEQSQEVYNRPRTAVYIYELAAKQKKHTENVDSCSYRPANAVFMELTGKTRKGLQKVAQFQWSDDFYRDLCVSWHDEQIRQGLCYIVYLCGTEAERAMHRTTGFCIACWYSNGTSQCFIPSQKQVNGILMPVIEAAGPLDTSYIKPQFTDNS